MVEVYYLDAIFLLLPLLELVRAAGWERRSGAVGWRRAATSGVMFAAAALVTLLPHFVVKGIIHGSPFATGYRDTFMWASPRLWQVGFSSEHGMFVWTPALLLATVGLGMFSLRHRRIGTALLVVFAGFYYAVASYQNWHGQSAFGSRFFVAFTSVFVLGLAELLDRTAAVAAARRPALAPRALLVWGVCLFPLVLWNIGFIFQWGVNLVPNRGPVDLSIVMRNQVSVVPRSLVGFLGRYLSNRDQATHEVELEDLAEVRDYRVVR